MAMKKASARQGIHISRFYVIYLISLVAVILVIIAALGIVSDRLAEFEAAQPKYVAAEIFKKYFDPVNYTDLLADAEYEAGAATPADIVEYLTNEIGDETLTYSIGSSTDAAEKKYIVKAGKKKLAAINLTLSEKVTAHGYATYEFSGIELYLPESGQTTPPDIDVPQGIVITVSAPTAYTVTVDGETLSAALVTSSYTDSKLMKYLPSGVEGIPYTVYTISGLEELPSNVVVTDSEGTEAEVTFNSITNAYTAGIVYSEAFAEQYGEYVTEAVEGYSAYMQASKSFSKISGYFDPDSDLYATIKAAGGDLWMVNKPTSYEFKDEVVDEFFMHENSVLSCHIKFTQVLYNKNSDDTIDVIDMYVFMRLTEDGYKIYEWHTNT